MESNQLTSHPSAKFLAAAEWLSSSPKAKGLSNDGKLEACMQSFLHNAALIAPCITGAHADDLGICVKHGFYDSVRYTLYIR